MRPRDSERKRERLKRGVRSLFGPSSSTVSTSTSTVVSQAQAQAQASPNTEVRPPDQIAGHRSLSGTTAQNVEVRDLWAVALQKLSNEDKETILQSGSVSKLDVLQDLCAAAERKRDDCENRALKFELNGRQIILRDLSEKIIVWINKFKEIGDIAVAYDQVHAALPWAGVRFLLQIAVAESQQMGALLVGVERATCLINRCRIYEILYLHDKQSGQPVENLEFALVALYVAMLQFLAKANRLYKSLSIRVLHGTLFPDQVVGFVKECEALESRVDIEAGNCERTYLRTAHVKLDECGERLKQLLMDLQKPIMRTDSRVAALYARLNESERFDILTWISSIQYEKNHRTAREGRTDGTGKWLLTHRRYCDWRGSSSSMILWLHGIPGAGKTKLVSTVVDDLLESFRQYPNDEALAYFYCDRNQSERRDLTLILNSFVRQLSMSKKDGSIQHSIVQLYKQKRQTGFASGTLDIEESRDILLQLVQSYPQITLVVDALDECNKQTRKQLVDTLDILVSRSRKLVKIFISSRLDEDIKHRFEDGPNMEIKATDNRDDITKFVADKMDNSPPDWQNRISPALKKEICETLVNKSEGMFQWVSLQIAQLLELLPRERDIRERLGKLPKTLDTAYDEIHARIQAQEGSAPDIANRAFQWVMCSYTPLSPAELVAAVSQDPETDVTDSVDIDMSIVLASCHNLLVVDQELGVCRLSHLSVQEYFENRYWSHSQANGLVAKVCLSLLNDPGQQERDSHATNEQDRNNGMCDTIQYARLHWAIHVQRHGEKSIDARLSTLLKQFLGSMNESGPAYRSWYKMINKLFGSNQGRSKFYSIPLYRIYCQLMPASLASFAICVFGFHKILSSWWVSGFANVDQLNHNGESLLQLAAMAGSVSITKELLRMDANVDMRNNNGKTALHRAAENGHEATVRLLLEAKADVDAKTDGGWTALHRAAENGHEATVRLLLEAKADVDAKDRRGWKALHRAARNGHEATVRLLLEAKADVDAKDHRGWMALHRAARNGDEATVRLLLEAKSDVDAKTNGGWTALHSAARNGDEATVRLLLEAKADVDAENNSGWTALHWAAENGHEATVRLLLEGKADVDAKNDSGWTALYEAARNGNEATVRLLQASPHPPL